MINNFTTFIILEGYTFFKREEKRRMESIVMISKTWSIGNNS